MMEINEMIDSRILDGIRSTGVKELTSRQVMAWLGCSSPVARSALARLAIAGALTVERRRITGWQKAGPGSGKSPLSHKTRLEYKVTERARLCAPHTVEQVTELLA